jgi:hypothetical protein
MEPSSRRSTVVIQPPPHTEATKIELPADQPALPTGQEGRSWPLLALYGVAALLIAVGIVFGARAIYHHSKNKNGPTITQPSDTTKAPSQTSLTTPSTNQPSTGSNTTNNSASSSSSGNLPNNGPGSVAAVFVGTSLLAGGLHYIITLRRAASK